MTDLEPGAAAQTCRVGIIGGGQLGWMLCRAARDLHLETIVLTTQLECPAAAHADRLLLGGLDDVAAAARLADAADVITFEIETVTPAVLELLASRAESGSVQVRPAPGVLLLLQNKLHQKQWLEQHGFPTAAFVAGTGAADDAKATNRLGLPMVQKAATGGYDGRGVQIIRDASSLERLWPVPGVLEAFVSNAVELAVVVARAADGSMAAYQPALMRFHTEGNVLDTVSAPATIAHALTARAISLAEDIVNRLDGIGVFCIEMFLTQNDELLINEISPRVHNAGHLTVEACETSQFEQHLRAVSGLTLGSTTQRRPAAMKNLLFHPSLTQLCGRAPARSVSNDAAVTVYWYGKRSGTPGRKMGHVTALAESSPAAECLANAASRDLSIHPIGARS